MDPQLLDAYPDTMPEAASPQADPWSADLIGNDYGTIPMNNSDQDESVPAVPGRNRVSRAFVPVRKAGHPLWQWVLVIAARIAAVPVLTFVVLTGIGYCQAVTGTGSLGEFSLMGFNRTDRTVVEFYVDGGWGPNVFAHGGGGAATCCTSIPRGSNTALCATSPSPHVHRIASVLRSGDEAMAQVDHLHGRAGLFAWRETCREVPQ